MFVPPLGGDAPGVEAALSRASRRRVRPHRSPSCARNWFVNQAEIQNGIGQVHGGSMAKEITADGQARHRLTSRPSTPAQKAVLDRPRLQRCRPLYAEKIAIR